MAQVPTGSTFYVASTIASAKTTTIVTNASEAVVTSAAHGYSNGDFVIILRLLEPGKCFGRVFYGKLHRKCDCVLFVCFRVVVGDSVLCHVVLWFVCD